MNMSKWNIASFPKEDQDKVSVDKAAADFRERLEVHRQNSQLLPRANAPEYNKTGDDPQK